jgi:hypothetical protein
VKSLRDAQSILDHPVEQHWDIVVLDNERRAKPVRVVLGVLANPFTRSLSERPNERKRSLWQNPNIGFVGRAFHCLPSVFATGGSGLIGKSGRKTANECDMHAKETTRNTITDFTAFLVSSSFSGNHRPKFPKRCRKIPSESQAAIPVTEQFTDFR